MPFITMILTIPFLYLAHRKNHTSEKLYLGKLLLLWLLCQLYITLNDTYKLPIGIVTAFIIAFGDETNKKPKLIAFAIGCSGFIFSNIAYLITSTR